MSIVAAENAGLGPCDLPDHWATSSSTNARTTAATTSSASLGTAAAASAASAANSINCNNIANTFPTISNNSAIASNASINSSTASTATTTTSSGGGGGGRQGPGHVKNICNLPRSSPAAATAAVTVSNAGSAVVGLAPVVPTSAGVVPLPTTIGSVGSAGGGGGAVAITNSGNSHNTNGNTTLTSASSSSAAAASAATDRVSPNTAAAANLLLARISALQQQQQQQQQQHHHLQQQQQQQHLFLNNQNPNNTLLTQHLQQQQQLQLQQQQQQQQQHQLQKAAATAANIAALQRPAIMNAVASPISTNSTTSSNRKIRRKNDSKANLPQSQINKCNNEKRRRELENNYIEQLSEFLQLNKRGDMTSSKPDKAAILNQVVKTYRDICDKGQSRDISSSTPATTTSATTTSSSSSSSNNTANASSTNNSNISSNNNNQSTSTRCSRCATDNCSIHPVQQGEVSSTEPPLPEPSLLNGQVPEISAYFEALEHYISSVGWVLLQVNAEGIIESCTQNIRELIGYEKQELYRKPLYMYLFPGDHAKLDPIINNMSSTFSTNNVGGTGGVLGGNSAGGPTNSAGGGGMHDLNSGWGLGGDMDDHNGGGGGSSGGSGGGKPKRSISTKVRMLVKDMRSATQTSGSNSSSSSSSTTTTTNNDSNSMDQKPKYEEVVLIAAPVKDDADSASSVLCLITRPEDESPLEMNIQQHVQHPTIEQVTFKLDIHGKIITLDATTLREPYKKHLAQWVGRLLQDICHPQDLSALKSHLCDVQNSASGVNAINASQSPSSGVAINPPISNVISKPFRLCLGTPDVYVHVKANSRLFINHTPGESDFIMSVQTLLNAENDMNSNNTSMLSGNGGLLTTAMSAMSPGSSLVSSLVSNLSMDSLVNNNSVSSPLVNVVSGLGGLVGGGGGGGGMQQQQHSTQTISVGGPLMTSAVINGTGGGGGGGGGNAGSSVNNVSGLGSQRTSSTTATTSGVASNNSSIVNSFTASPAGHEGPSFYNDFDFDLRHSSFEMDPSVSAWNDSRPNSRASVTTPVSTPRPPSAGHGFSPAICPSPSTPYQLSSHSAASLPSPQSNASQSGVGGGGGGGGGGPFGGFGFHSFDSNSEKLDKEQLNNNNNNNSNNNMSGNMAGNLPNGGGGGPQNSLMMGAGGSSSVSGMSINSQQSQQQQQQNQQTSNAPQQQHPPTESERLRHLLTNKTHSSASSLHGGDGGDDKDNLMKFYKQEDDKESLQVSLGGMFKMGPGSGPGGPAGMLPSRMFGPGGMPKQTNSSNPMLLSLLKSEDDESNKGMSSMGRSGDLVRIKDEPHGSHQNPNNMSTEDLRRILKHQGDPAMTRKRSLNDPDDGLSAKRSDDRPSKLCESNKMLARLLSNPPKNITMNITPVIKTIPDKVPSSVGRVSSSLGGGGTAQSMGLMPGKSSTITTMAGSGMGPGPGPGPGRGRGPTQHNKLSQQQQQQQQPSDVYLSQQQQQQQQQGLESSSAVGSNLQRLPQSLNPQQGGQMDFSSSTTGVNPFATPPLSTTAPSTTATSNSSATTGTSSGILVDGDQELSKILDSVMDYVPDDQPSGLTPQQINERLAISEIQKSLMVETSAFRVGPMAMAAAAQTAQQMLQQQMQQHQQQQQQMQQQQQQHHSQLQPPAYPGSMLAGLGGGGNLTPQQQVLRMQVLENMRASQNFQRPPPNYPARGRAPMNAVATPGGGVMPALTQQRYRALAHQQIVHHKERLLQQQQKQHMLVPENATARDQMCLNPGLNNISTLLNTVAPNVTLSRTNMPPDSQLSPNFAQTMLQQQLSPGQRNAPFSPQSNPGYGPQYPQTGQRLSPQQQQQLSQQQQQQQMAAFQASNAAQLSPRQPHFGAGGPNTPGSAGIPSPGLSANASPQQWGQGGGVGGVGPNSAQQRGHSLQQHNPMLSAQLQVKQGVSPYNARQYQQQQQQRGRGLNSPSGTGPQSAGPGGGGGGPQGPSAAGLQRQNSFQTNDSGFTPTPNSPSPQSPYGTGNVFQQQQQQQQQQQNQQQMQQRMQRQASIPQATQHLPAGNPASSDYVKQELRAVVSGRAAAAANSGGGNGVPGGGGGNGPGGGIPGGLRVATPQSPLGPQTPQGSMQHQHGTNNSNPMTMGQQQQPQTPNSAGGGNGPNSGSGVVGSSTGGGGVNSMLHSSPDPTMGFSFDTQDFFGSSSTR